MKIHYSPHYDGDIYLGDTPHMMGETYVGNNELLEQLQLRAGRHMTMKSDVEREANYHNAMVHHLHDTIFEKAAEVDPFGVASKLMHWRDALIMAGWDGKCEDTSATKISVLADIEDDFQAQGAADCWKMICDTYRDGVVLNGSIECIMVECPWSEIPYLIRETLLALKTQGVEIRETIEKAALDNLSEEGRIRLVEFDDVNEAYEWFATIETMPQNCAVINRDNVRLNHTLYTWDKPQVHASLMDSNPQLLQLFKLSMSIYSRPLNIQNLLSYLMLPLSPIPSRLRRKLARLLLEKGGFGDKQIREDGKTRDDWDEAIETFEFLGKDDNDSPQAKGKAKANKMPYLSPIRKNYDCSIKKAEIIDYIGNMKRWILGLFADKDMPTEMNAQLHELNIYFLSLETSLLSCPEHIQYEDIEKLMLQIYRPMNYSLQAAETGSYNVISDIRALAIGADTLLWLDCQDEQLETDPYDFLSKVEKDYLTGHGCTIPDFAEHLKTCRMERLRMISACKDIILVRSKFDGTSRLGEHSIIAEVRQAYKAADKEWKAVDKDECFKSQPKDMVEDDVERMQPVLALELGSIDYAGRKESNSSLDTLINLPFNYVMQYVAKLPKPGEDQLSNTFVTKGLVAHNFFEHIIKDTNGDLNEMRRLTEEEFEERTENAIEATGLMLRMSENASDLTVFRRQMKDSMLSLIEIMERKGWTPEGVEIELPADCNDPLHLDTIGNFGARIDFLCKQGDSYIIIDFKWSYGKKYEKNLEENTAIQLELYRKSILATHPDKEVLGVGYYLMPKLQLFTTDIEEIDGSKLIKKVTKEDESDLFKKIQNSYLFRMAELKRGHIEEAETMDIMDCKDSYYAHTADKNLCPLHVEEKRTRSKELVSVKKSSEQVFKPSKKKTFIKTDAAPSEIATSHPILKGRLK